MASTASHAAASGRQRMAMSQALIASARVFDLYQGQGVPEGFKSLAIEAQIQPVEASGRSGS